MSGAMSAVTGLFGGNNTLRAPSPAAPKKPAATEAMALRAQNDGQRATAGGLEEFDNEADTLGSPKRRSGASRALLG